MGYPQRRNGDAVTIHTTVCFCGNVSLLLEYFSITQNKYELPYDRTQRRLSINEYFMGVYFLNNSYVGIVIRWDIDRRLIHI